MNHASFFSVFFFFFVSKFLMLLHTNARTHAQTVSTSFYKYVCIYQLNKSTSFSLVLLFQCPCAWFINTVLSFFKSNFSRDSNSSRAYHDHGEQHSIMIMHSYACAANCKGAVARSHDILHSKEYYPLPLRHP